MAFSRAASEFKMARDAAAAEAEAARINAQLQADPDIVHVDSCQEEDEEMVAAEAIFAQAQQRYEAAKAAASAAKVLSR